LIKEAEDIRLSPEFVEKTKESITIMKEELKYRKGEEEEKKLIEEYKIQ